MLRPSKRSRESSEDDKGKQQDPNQISIHRALKQRSTSTRRFGRTFNVSARFVLPLFQCPSNNIFQFIFPDHELCTPFYCDYSHQACDGQLLAVADEDGRLSILRTDKDNHISNLEYHNSFYCHRHAMTDVKWSKDDTMLATASIDRVIRLWDAETKTSLAEFAGHNDCVRSVNWHPTNEHLIITGSKDGSYKIWDTRFNQKVSDDNIDDTTVAVYSAIKTVTNAHSDVKTTNKTSKKSGFQSRIIRSVTCAMFLNSDEDKVISSGSVDGTIKLWDVRAGRTPKAIETAVFENEQGRKHGITDMKIDHSGTRLFSSCLDNSIYMNYLSDLSKPARRFIDPDYKVGSYDIKISLSPDDQFLLSGSLDKNVFAWEVDGPFDKAHQYQGHSKKVTGVTWNKRNINQFASCSEDFTTRIWKLGTGIDV
ncbi:hypothetical protein MFLAVUS_008431 [Mucor flavus]|uniref:WD40 repeat-like protein n=1 Tax=Mucor flavus TaxID=439312 RepID=A0ABP9Z757_9FUNG